MGVGLVAGDASACPPSGVPWVQVAVDGDAKSLRAREIARLLGAELASRHIATCEDVDPAAPPPLARVTVRTTLDGAPRDRVVVTVDVRDAVTAKSVQRDVDLASVPSDGRPLTVALAADELLRASWAELAVRDAPPPARPVPPEVRDVVRDAIPSASERPPRFAFGAAAAIDAFTAGTTLLGADVLVDVWLVSRLRVGARFGLRSGLVVHASDGDVSTSAFVAELGAAVTLTPPALRFGLDASVRAGILRASFDATPAGSATARSLADVAAIGDAGVVVWARLSPGLRASADVAAVLPLRPIEATDGPTVIGGISGVGIASSLALRGTF